MRKAILAATVIVCVLGVSSSGASPGVFGLLIGQQEVEAELDRASLPGSASTDGLVKRGRSDPFAPLRKRSHRPVARKTFTDTTQDFGPDLDVTELFLSGIVWSAKRPLAVINRNLVGVDDRISGWRIVEIQRDKVMVEQDDRKEILKIKIDLFENNRRNG